MALSQRERTLAIATGVLVLPFAAWLVVGALGGSTKQLLAQQANLVNEINDAKKLIREGHEAQDRLDAWNRESLPQDVEAAGSLYKIWLMQLCESDEYKARFQNTQVKPMKSQPIGDVGTYLSFNVTGVASLEQLTRWLYGFYSADYLHQIKGLTITPLEESKKLNLVIQIEALALNGATDREGKPRRDALQELPDDRIDEKLLDKYCATIGERAIFSRYTPPPPVRPPDPPRVEPSRPLFDHGKYTRITGITEVDGRPAVWISMMTSGKELRLFEGESFEVGPVQAKILEIQIQDRTIKSEVEGKQYLLALGDNMRDAKEISVASPSDTSPGAAADVPVDSPSASPVAPPEAPAEGGADAPSERSESPVDSPSTAPLDEPGEAVAADPSV